MVNRGYPRLSEAIRAFRDFSFFIAAVRKAELCKKVANFEHPRYPRRMD